MGQITEDVRIGLSVHDFKDFWGDHGASVTGSSDAQETDDGGIQWSGEGTRGLIQPTADDNSTLLRVTIEADDPRAELDRLLDRFSEALASSGSISGASFSVEPRAEAAPDEETSADQPL